MREPNVHVSILIEKEIYFDLYGDYQVSGRDIHFSGKYKAEMKGNRILISGNGLNYEFKDSIILEPGDYDSDSFLVRDVIIGIQFHWEQKENQRFRGSLKFILQNDTMIAVNILKVEDYLTSVISSEMSATSSSELLKAHAIISRSWLLAQMENRKNEKSGDEIIFERIENDNEIVRWYDRQDHLLFDVCADDHCQRYQGITKLHAHNAQDAVELTRGIVLKFNNKICDTRFSKSCGGVSESFENVWEPVVHPYLSSVIDYKFAPDNFNMSLTEEKAAIKWIKSDPPAFCNTHDKDVLSQVLLEYDQKTTDFYRWEVKYTQDEIAELIKTKLEIDFGKIIDLIPVERGVSGRLIKLRIVGEKRTMIIGKELEIRRALSKSHLYSSAFTVEKSNFAGEFPGEFKIIGAGWGHGVGLCQIGAAVMSEMGYRFDEILLHYFKGAKITKQYE